jgi:hypothetical protein
MLKINWLLFYLKFKPLSQYVPPAREVVDAELSGHFETLNNRVKTPWA